MKRLLVTGAAGFIGSHLVDRLLSSGEAEVIGLDRFDDFYDPAAKRAIIAPHLAHPSDRLIEVEVRDEAALSRLLADERFDAIVHLAARAGVRPSLIEPRLYAEVNITGTVNLLELARRAGIRRFIFGSSSSVYGPTAEPPCREDAPRRQCDRDGDG